MVRVVVAEPTKQRITSIDAYRGFVMFLMLAEVLHLSGVAERFPTSDVWRLIGHHATHVPWRGGSLHDMIQPSFSFLVGVAVPFSIAARMAKGHGFGNMLFHAILRALVLIGLGIFLRSDGLEMTNFTFMDTLAQIGMGYVFLFLLGFRSPAWHWGAFAFLVLGSFAIYASHPLPPPDFDYPAVGVPANWPHHAEGFAAHWNKNSNAGWAFDQWFLNLFGRPQPFVFNAGGYATLNVIPTLATMILGLIAGTWMKAGLPRGALLLRLLLAGTLAFSAGYALDLFGVIPNVKRIWTPAWTLYSGGVCFLMLLVFSLLFDNSPLRALAFPLVVIGANSIFIYCVNALLSKWLVKTLATHLFLLERKYEFRTYTVFGPEYESAVRGGLVLLIYWLLLLWMYRKRIFVKI